MKLFQFAGVETEWVAADDEASARDVLMRHYGIDAADVADSYESISVVDPTSVELFTDAVNAETEEPIMTTAAAMMAGKTRPFVVGSTCE